MGDSEDIFASTQEEEQEEKGQQGQEEEEEEEGRILDAECCFWSPRGRKVVRRENCKIEDVTSKTVLRIPLLVKQEGRSVQEDREILDGEEMQDTVRLSRKRKHESSPPTMSQSEASRRFKAFKWMLEQGRLQGLVNAVCQKSVKVLALPCRW